MRRKIVDFLALQRDLMVAFSSLASFGTVFSVHGSLQDVNE